MDLACWTFRLELLDFCLGLLDFDFWTWTFGLRLLDLDFLTWILDLDFLECHYDKPLLKRKKLVCL